MTEPTNTPTRRNRGGSSRQYADLVRFETQIASELRARFYAVTPSGSLHERLRWIVEQQERRQEGALT